MKLIKFGTQGSEKPGVLLSNGTSIDVSACTPDFNEAFFESGGLHRLSSWLETHAATAPVVAPGTRLGSPIARPSKIICIGLNYSDHAKESGMAVPAEPIIFFKSTTALTGPNDDLVIPAGSEKTDWEVELAVVIGKTARSDFHDSSRARDSPFELPDDPSRIAEIKINPPQVPATPDSPRIYRIQRVQNFRNNHTVQLAHGKGGLPKGACFLDF